MIVGKFLASDDFDLAGHRFLNWNFLADIPAGGADTGDVMAWNGVQWIPIAPGDAGLITWNDIADKPSVFPPEDHTHDWSDILNVEVEFEDLEEDIQESLRFFVGATLGSPVVDVTSDGTDIALTITSANDSLVLIFQDGYHTYSTATPAPNIVLTSGTDTVPVLNYVYIPSDTKVLTVSTTAWPSSIDYVPIATVFCQSAASAQTYGVYKMHAWTDHTYTDDNTGHLAHLNSWIRNQPATWTDGTLCVPTLAGGVFDVVVNAGTVLQLHDHAFPAFDTSSGSDVYIVNEFGTPYNRRGDLTGVLADSSGVSMMGKFYNLVIWGVVSEDASDCKLMVNVPSGAYTSAARATADEELTTNYSIPSDFTGTGFLIARLIVRHQNPATFSLEQNIDLRGTVPSVFGGGATGGSPEFSDADFAVYDEANPLHKVKFDVLNLSGTQTFIWPIEAGQGFTVVSSPDGLWTSRVLAGTNISTTDGTTNATVAVVDAPTFAGTCTADSINVSETDVATKSNIVSTFDVTGVGFDANAYKGICSNIDYETGGAGTGGLGSFLAFGSDLAFNDQGYAAFVAPMQWFKGTLDLNGVATSYTAAANSPMSLKVSNASTTQTFPAGVLSVEMTGGNSGDQVAVFSTAIGPGTSNAIGYKGFAGGKSGSTGSAVGVQGYGNDISGANHSALIGLDGVVLGAGSTPTNKRMGLRANAHGLFRGASVFCTTTASDLSPSVLSPNHVQANTNLGELYVEGVAEFVDEVFADGNESHSLVETTTTPYAAAGVTYIMVDATAGNKVVNLPAISGLSGNREYVVMKTDAGANTVTVTPNGADTINGAATHVLSAQYTYARYIAGTQWFIVG